VSVHFWLHVVQVFPLGVLLLVVGSRGLRGGAVELCSDAGEFFVGHGQDVGGRG